jgi:hypothetical protein
MLQVPNAFAGNRLPNKVPDHVSDHFRGRMTAKDVCDLTQNGIIIVNVTETASLSPQQSETHLYH